MDDNIRYPLTWPVGWPRTPAGERRASNFSETTLVERKVLGSVPGGVAATKKIKGTKRVSMAVARARIVDQVARLGGIAMMLSTNVEVTVYGLPKAGRAAPADPGAAVYFELHGKDRVLACDRWATVAENIAAIAAHIDAIRRVERYGIGSLDQAFAGYTALPAPGKDNRPVWRRVFSVPDGTNPTLEDVQKTYRLMARKLHPDQPGGSQEAMSVLNLARDEALRELGAGA
jgi:hypothetical protein